MELKPGYKMTEVGVIPEDWEVKRLGDIGQFFKGRGVKKDEAQSGTLPCIRYGEIYTHHNDYIKSFKSRISPQIAATATRLKQGDLLFAASGETKEEIGKCVAFIDDCEAYAGGDTVILRATGINPMFMGYYCNTATIAAQKASKGQGDAVVHISAAALSSIVLALPSFPEQGAIAQALSDVDALLAALDRLIAKKQAIKQATMQPLLTGKKRLPGFSGAWEVKRLGEIADIRSGGTPATSVASYYNGDIPWVSISDMTNGGKFVSATERNLTRLGFANCPAQMFPAGTVLYAMYASLGECSIAAVPVCSSQAILGIRPFDILNNEFLYHYLCSLKQAVKSIGQQGTQANLNKRIVQSLQISLPTLDEQRAIVKVLSDMDAELSALKTRRDKTRQLKHAMMQELLTGKTRLLTQEHNHA